MSLSSEAAGTRLRIGGLDVGTWDLVVRVPPGSADIQAGAADVPAGEAGWSPGGTVGNVLAAMARLSQDRRPGAGVAQLYWLGVTAPPDLRHEPPAGVLGGLRRAGVMPFSVGRMAETPRVLRPVDDVTGECIATPAPTFPRDLAESARASCMITEGLGASLDVLILSAAQLSDDLVSGVPCVAVVLDESVDTDRLVELAGAAPLRWLVDMTGSVAGGGPPAELSGAELVALGADEVTIWTPDSPAPRRLPLRREALPAGDALGIGEAYAGAYLLGRLLGDDVAAAHAAATVLAAQVSGRPGARPAAEPDLNRIFADLIDRSSERADEAELFDRVRTAAGLVVVSGGQTGVDQIALDAAAQLGIPSFCILPDGRRTEVTEGIAPGPDRFFNAHVEVLSSHSYRFRTWTTCYLADATLIWDFHTSEGCATAREACAALGRPFLDVVPLTDPAERRRQVWDFVTRHDVRVINVEGNRETLLSAPEAATARAQLLDLLRVIAARQRRSVEVALERDGTRPVVVGVPNVPGQRALFGRFLTEVYGLEPPQGRGLVVEHPELAVAYARARDLPALLREGAVDLVVCGSDLLDPAAGRTLLDTGLHPLLHVVVGRAGSAGRPVAEVLAGSRVGSQDVRLAARLLDEAAGYRGDIREIEGTAETWIRRGLLDVAVDTWSTGATAQENGLDLLCVLAETSLVVATRDAEPLPAGAADLVAAFARWLSGE